MTDVDTDASRWVATVWRVATLALLRPEYRETVAAAWAAADEDPELMADALDALAELLASDGPGPFARGALVIVPGDG